MVCFQSFLMFVVESFRIEITACTILLKIDPNQRIS